MTAAKVILICWLGLKKHQFPRERIHLKYSSVFAAVLSEYFRLRDATRRNPTN